MSIVFPEDPAPGPVDYRPGGVEEYLDCMNAVIEIAVDTESHGGTPWSVQLSHTPATACMVRVNDRHAIGYLCRWFCVSSTDAIFHNASYDIEVLRKLGIHVSRYRDTMQEAFHLGNLPQGLKPLVYRLFRETMTSYEDVVRPASIAALQMWLAEALLVARADLSRSRPVVRRTCVCGHTERSHWSYAHAVKCGCVDYRPRIDEVEVPGDAESLIQRLIRHTDVHGTYDPWPRLEEWRDAGDGCAHVEARCGPFPILGIGNCRMEDAVRYACGDADYTLRVAVELERRRQGAFAIAPGDEDR